MASNRKLNLRSDTDRTNTGNDSDIDLSDSTNHYNEENNEAIDDDEHTALRRLSDNYRRFSESKKLNEDGHASMMNEDGDVQVHERQIDEDEFVFENESDNGENSNDDDEDDGNFGSYEFHDEDDDEDDDNGAEDPEEDYEDDNVEDDHEGTINDTDFAPFFNNNPERSSALRFLASTFSNSTDLDSAEEGFRAFLTNRDSSTNHNSSVQNGGASRSLSTSGTPNRQNVQRMMMNSFLDHFIPGGSSQSNQFTGLMEGLKSHREPYMIMETLNEISNALLMMPSIQSERQVPTTELAKQLVEIINEYPDHLELQLVACRCIYNLAEVNFELMDKIVSAGVIECLNSKLLDLSYIDMAEQALQALEIISRKNGRSILIKGSIPVSLTYLDFFTIHAQRKALKIASNSSILIPKSKAAEISEVFPIIKNVAINYTDPQCVESAWIFIANTIISFYDEPILLLNLLDDEFVTKLCELIPLCLSNGKHATGLVTFKTCIKILDAFTLLCKRSALFSNKLLLQCNFGTTMIKIFLSYRPEENRESDEHSMLINALLKCPKELLVTLLRLLISLLPLRAEKIDVDKTKDFDNYIHIRDSQKDINAEKNVLFENQRHEKIFDNILPMLLDIYDATVEYEVRRLVFICILRIIYLMEPLELESVVYPSKIISVLASSLTHSKSLMLSKSAQPKDSEILNFYSLLFGTCLVTGSLISGGVLKFLEDFNKEGIIFQINELKTLFSGKINSLSQVEDIDVSAISDDDLDSNDDLDDDFEDDDMIENEDMEFAIQHRTTYHKSLDTESKQMKSFPQISILNSLLSLLSYVSSTYQSIIVSKNVCKTLRMQHLEKFLKDFEYTLTYDKNDIKKWSEVWDELSAVLDNNKFDGEKALSSFEIISTGAISKILQGFEKQDSYTTGMCKSFMATFCSRMSENISEDFSPLLALIKKLEEILDRNESFQIVGLESDNTSNSRQRAQSMSKQMKIKLTPKFEGNEEEKGNSNKGVLLVVHAIATLETIQNFIKNSKSVNLRNTFNLNSSSLDNDFHYEFYINDQLIPSDATIFGAIYKAYEDDTDQLNAIRENPNHQIHNIQYKTVHGKLLTDDKPLFEESVEEALSILGDSTVIDTLKLVRVLYNIHAEVPNPNVNDSVFLNYKLTAKLNRQLDEPLFVASGILPEWAIIIPREFSFLFPIETRLFFLKSTSFGYSRLIDLWTMKSRDEGQDDATNSGFVRTPMLGRSIRHKLRISREKMFSSAIKVMETYATNPGLIEIEFFDEIGSGLGPTLEFYSQVSKDFRRLNLFMWRSDKYPTLRSSGDGDADADVNFTFDKHGLFPRPLDCNNVHFRSTLLYFKVLGKFIARSFLDSRLVDFHFNPLFFELAMKYATKKKFDFSINESLKMMRQIDQSLASSIGHLQRFSDGLQNVKEEDKESYTLDGVNVSDLMLTFVVPGYEDTLLINDGNNVFVTNTNLDEYIAKLIDYTLYEGIGKQVESFVDGFSEIFPFSSLILFSPDELTRLLGNETENWSRETLASVIHADHGYNNFSPQIAWLVEIMSDFSKEDRRKFLRFMTGSPRLPFDGFKGLSPPFTVVLKHCENGLKPDDYLPSVMTCANYLKLPCYSSREIMLHKVVQAMNGNDGFLLS